MINVNLLPPEKKEEIARTRMNLGLVKATAKTGAIFVAFALVLVGFYLYFQSALKAVSAEYINKEGQIKKYGALEEKAKKIAERVNTIKEISANTFIWSGVIDEITKIVPDGVSLKNIKIDSVSKNRNLLTGDANSKTAVAALRDAMEKSDKFQYVDIESSTTTKDLIKNTEYESFTISYSLEKGALK